MGKLFVTLFAPLRRDFVATHLNFCSYTLDKFVMAVAPGHAHLHAIKILHLDKFLAPRQIVPRSAGWRNTTSPYYRAVRRHKGLTVNKLNIVDIWKK
jgi:hypothetical protein